MSLTNQQAAQSGWRLYQESGGSLSRDEINEELDQSQLPEISARMYNHYGRMARHRVSDYMPINEFDMAVKHGDLGETG
jgi:hypothetical protein